MEAGRHRPELRDLLQGSVSTLSDEPEIAPRLFPDRAGGALGRRDGPPPWAEGFERPAKMACAAGVQVEVDVSDRALGGGELGLDLLHGSRGSLAHHRSALIFRAYSSLRSGN